MGRRPRARSWSPWFVVEILVTVPIIALQAVADFAMFRHLGLGWDTGTAIRAQFLIFCFMAMTAQFVVAAWIGTVAADVAARVWRGARALASTALYYGARL